MKKSTTLFFLFFFLCRFILSGQSLVADINTNENGSNPDLISGSGDTVVFVATSDVYGREIFYSINGEESKILYDFSIGTENSNFFDIEFISGNVYIALYRISAGITLEIYQLDFKGNSKLLYQKAVAQIGDKNGSFTKIQNKIYFLAQDGLVDYNVYVLESDGPRYLTTLPSAFTYKPIYYDKDGYYSYSGNAFLKINTQVPPYLKTYVTDKNILEIIPYGKGYLYSTYTNSGKFDLLFFNGENEPVKVIKDHPSLLSNLTEHNNKVFYLDVQFGQQILLKSTIDTFKNSKLELSLDVNTYTQGQKMLSTVNGLFLLLYNKQNGYVSLCKYDESNNSLIKINDIGNDLVSIGNPVEFIAFYTKNYGKELYQIINGTIQPTLIKDINEGNASAEINALFKFKNKLYYAANDNKSGKELWITDVISKETKQFSNINFSKASSNPYQFLVANDKLHFSANDGLGFQLWRYSKSTNLATKAYSEVIYRNPLNLFNINDNVVFEAMDSTGRGSFFTLIKNTSKIEKLVQQTNAAISGNGIGSIINNKFIFQYYTPNYGGELWVSDGTPLHTQFLKDINPGTAQSYPSFTNTKIGSHVFFSAFYKDQGQQLWKSDGSAEGTVFVKDTDPEIVPPNVLTSFLGNFTQINDKKVVFTTQNQLWATDGSESGTILLLQNVIPSSSPFVLKGNCYIITTSPDNTSALFKTDGTIANTIKIANFPDNYYKSILGGTKDYFLYSSYENGNFKIYKTDGSNLGQVLTSQLENGPINPSKFFVFNDTIYFLGTDETHGNELWISDGTKEGTKILFDLNPGSASSESGGFVVYKNELYFSGNDGKYGNELWKISSNSIVEIGPLKPSVLLYPNPTNDLIYIDLPYDSPDHDIYLYNTSGDLIIHQKNKDHLSLGNLATGTYFIKVVQNQQLFTQKIMLIK